MKEKERKKSWDIFSANEKPLTLESLVFARVQVRRTVELDGGEPYLITSCVPSSFLESKP